MEPFLKLNKIDPRLNYYQKGRLNRNVDSENYCLAGFKNNLPVVFYNSAGPNLNQSSSTKVLKTLPSNVKFSKVLLDEHGEKFINLNGQKLKVVPQGQIPEEVRKRTFLLKKQLVNSGLKNPLKVHVIGNAPKGDKSLAGQIKLIKPSKANLNSSIHIASSSSTSQPVDSPVSTEAEPVKPIELDNADVNLSECLPSLSVFKVSSVGTPVSRKKLKLLTTANLKILNQVKMQALNLSKRKDESNGLRQYKRRCCQSVGIQTDIDNKEKKFNDQMVQTDIQESSSCMPHSFTSPFHDFDLYNMESSTFFRDVLLADVNLGSGPTMGPIPIKQMQPFSGPYTSSVNDRPENSITREEQDDLTKKKMMFFMDLRQCLVYNAEGNLPLHEGVINDNLGLIKRHCAALKARKAGVNLETHNGCTPLQLAIINNVQGDIVRTLLDYGADIKDVDGEGNNILHLGAMFQRHEALGIILTHKSFDSCSQCIDDYNFEGLTPLMVCCIRSWTAGALLFIGNSANVNCRDQTSGRTALFHAAEAQNSQIVKLLLDHHADPKIKNFFGTSPHDAMYELDDMSDTIKSLIFGRTKKRSIEAEMNPLRTAKAVKSLKTYPKMQKLSPKSDSFTAPPVRYRIEQKIK